MNSASLPTASSPLPTDDAEVESRKGLNQEEVVLEAPQGDLPDSRPKEGKPPEGSKSGSGPDTAPEPSTVPESDRRRLHKKGKPMTPATSVHPEAPDNLLEVLNGASIEGAPHCYECGDSEGSVRLERADRSLHKPINGL